MGILSWLLLGALAGWIVSLLMKNDAEQGAIGNIIVGVIGGLIGGFLGRQYFGSDVNGLNLHSVVLAILGGLVFSYLLRLFTGRPRTR